MRLVFEMAPLSERQEKAAGLARWLASLGAFVINPMPLDPGQKSLRFDVLHDDRERVLAELRKEDWSPTVGVVHMRFHRDELVPCTTYELDLPPDPPVIQDRRIYGELADEDKAAKKAARNAFLRELGYLKKNESA